MNSYLLPRFGVENPAGESNPHSQSNRGESDGSTLSDGQTKMAEQAHTTLTQGSDSEAVGVWALRFVDAVKAALFVKNEVTGKTFSTEVYRRATSSLSEFLSALQPAS